jgi:elongation factor G
VACCEWNKYKINILDIPGFADFIVDGQIAMSAADTALVLVVASSGVEVMTERAWDLQKNTSFQNHLY